MHNTQPDPEVDVFEKPKAVEKNTFTSGCVCVCVCVLSL